MRLTLAFIGVVFAAVEALGDAPDLSGVDRASQPEWWGEAPRRPVSRPQARTLTVMGGEVIRYQVTENNGALYLRLLMSLDDYDAAGRLGRRCAGACVLRVYIVQGRE